ncbi:hypothetical protein [Streptomyces sp. F001]|uniref:ABC transporter permease subunit n=1 Tax=Streptomyces sp. F001 TaxID=1510026 RepID=UPI0019D2C9AE|nr:hypothetical protein [Streptomyces sp. F001]
MNALAGLIWSFTVKDFPQPFPDGGMDLAGVRVDWSTLGIIAVALVMGLLYLLFQHTSVGLVMRAAACNAVSARLSGIRVGRVLMLGWGCRTVGAVSGVLVARCCSWSPT